MCSALRGCTLDLHVHGGQRTRRAPAKPPLRPASSVLTPRERNQAAGIHSRRASSDIRHCQGLGYASRRRPGAQRIACTSRPTRRGAAQRKKTAARGGCVASVRSSKGGGVPKLRDNETRMSYRVVFAGTRTEERMKHARSVRRGGNRA